MADNLVNTDEVTSTQIFAMPMSSEEHHILDYIMESQKFGNIYDLVSYSLLCNTNTCVHFT